MYHGSYEKLAYLTDTYGPRLWGTIQLEMFIDELGKISEQNGEPVTNFTPWIRGHESLILYEPRQYPTQLPLIGLGKSSPGNVTAEVLVVTSFDDLEAKKDQVKGKIVCYSVEWVNYGTTVQYRSSGAVRAEKYGAVGALVRSVTPFSIASPHTGGTQPNTIPFAAISVEDSEMFLRMAKRNQTIRVSLYMDNHFIQNANSSNFIAEIKGSEYPEQIVLFGGHMDSWDTGSQTGANDDGGGIITCLEALLVIKQLGFQPKRTMRVIGWSGEEQGGAYNGAQWYVKQHADELDNHVVAFESDLGSTKPYGYGFSGSDKAFQMITQLAQTYLQEINCTHTETGGEAVDIGPLFDKGVPMMINLIWDYSDKHEYYFTFHHSAGDTMDVMDPDDMDDNVVMIAQMMYLLASIDEFLPR